VDTRVGGVAKTLGTKWVNNQLINAGFLKVAYCEFQLDLQCYFHTFALAKHKLLSIETYGSFLLGSPFPSLL